MRVAVVKHQFLIIPLFKTRIGELMYLLPHNYFSNQAGPYGAFPGQTHRHILCFSSSLKYLANRI